jgi:hypothetical protein
MEVWLYGKMPLFLPVPGRHNVSNAMAAVALGMIHGIDPATIRIQLRGVRLPSLRMQRVAFRGVTLFLDCYNANPASLAAAVDELSTRPTPGRRILVAATCSNSLKARVARTAARIARMASSASARRPRATGARSRRPAPGACSGRDGPAGDPDAASRQPAATSPRQARRAACASSASPTR